MPDFRAFSYTYTVKSVYGRDDFTEEELRKRGYTVAGFRPPQGGEYFLHVGTNIIDTCCNGLFEVPRLILRRIPKYRYVTDGVERVIKLGDWFLGSDHKFHQLSSSGQNSACLCFTREEVPE